MIEVARAIVIAAIIVSGSQLVGRFYGGERWQIATSVGGAVYRLDRLTGTLWFCTAALCRQVPTAVVVAPAGTPPAASKQRDST